MQPRQAVYPQRHPFACERGGVRGPTRNDQRRRELVRGRQSPRMHRRTHQAHHPEDAQLDPRHGERRREQRDPASHLRVRGRDLLIRRGDHAALGANLLERVQVRGGPGQRGRQRRQDHHRRGHTQHCRQHTERDGGQTGDPHRAREDRLAHHLLDHTEWHD